ncbi:type IV pilus secretin PilQ [Litoribrevibacter euphylliae]|uniref:Type IV pilus secretin PilQ n=1 Tax=Litoribrevibacter euphylliae TaxID=1834034 RepID=A0ABV7HIX8_9GAMM
MKFYGGFGSMNMKNKSEGVGSFIKWMLLTCFSLGVSAFANAVSLNKLDVSSLANEGVEVRLSFDGAPPQPKGYTIEKPARISLDLMGVQSGLKEKYHKLGFGNARSLTVIEAKDRTRVIVNLTELVEYKATVSGNSLILALGGGDKRDTVQDSLSKGERQHQFDDLKKVIQDIDFRRGESGEGRVLITVSDPSLAVDMESLGSKIFVTFPDGDVPPELMRRLDVTDFATPVTFVDMLKEDGVPKLTIETAQTHEYLAYQTDNLLTINIKPITEEEAEERRKQKFPYSGEKLSLNFQDIEVRSVLQLIADFTSLNLVASDTVAGRITLRLQNVPWDQALDLVLKTKGLDKRKIGNVLLVAPADEIAAREKLELEAQKQVAELAPLETDFLQIRYAKAADVVNLLKADQGLLTERGSASVDERTNTIIVRDTAKKLDEIRDAMKVLDIPVRQVLIEARIVIATKNLGKELGVRWGGAAWDQDSDTFKGISGNLTGLNSAKEIYNSTNKTDFENQQSILEAQNQFLQDLAAGTATVPDFVELKGYEDGEIDDGMVVDLAATNSNATTFALGIAAFDYVIDLELSALETEGKGEIISQPKIITADGQTARIESGTEIPYQEASSSGATTTSFKDAVLSLEVTPQITPDDRIIMDLEINQDSVGEIFNGIPSIDTQALKTQVIVENGETIVLGGIFRGEDVEQVEKTPFLGDLPYIGALFRRTTQTEDKAELLMFITPKLVKDTLSVR